MAEIERLLEQTESWKCLADLNVHNTNIKVDAAPKSAETNENSPKRSAYP
jgi:hypothetical protein